MQARLVEVKNIKDFYCDARNFYLIATGGTGEMINLNEMRGYNSRRMILQFYFRELDSLAFYGDIMNTINQFSF